ncbi:hypothetical protein [Paenibacillus sp. UNC451MF]|uniref:hypothetical protein n=1 Tax=Paenibacillus sp. UNC451MF TaxID=1449063 RepID=UPI000490FDBD|nr:hypothetical protein [Paenibacillus sp. UNC451MF]
MNPGYLSLLLMVVTLILFASGWKDIVMRGITSKVILLFFISWLICMNLSVPVGGGRISLCFGVLLITILYVLWRVHGTVYRVHLLSVGALLGSISFFMLETIHLVPKLILGSSEISMGLTIGLLVSLLTRQPAVQIASLSIGLMLAEVYHGYLHRNYLGFQLGFQTFQDRWWLTLFITRTFSLVLLFSMQACKKSVLWLSDGIRRRHSGDSE